MAKRRQAAQATKARNKAPSAVVGFISGLFKVLWRPGLIMVSLAVMMLAVGYTQLTRNEVMPITAIKFEGELKFINEQELSRQTQEFIQQGFFSVDLVKVREKLLLLPWVDEISIRRQWPDQLNVSLVEKKAVVYWGDNQLLSSKGQLFKPEENIALDLPYLIGPHGQHVNMLKELSRMQAWLLEIGLTIGLMKLDERRSWTLVMVNGLELRLGRKQMLERLQRFALAYEDKLQADKRKIKHIDMRYTNGFAVAWKEA